MALGHALGAQDGADEPGRQADKDVAVVDPKVIEVVACMAERGRKAQLRLLRQQAFADSSHAGVGRQHHQKVVQPVEERDPVLMRTEQNTARFASASVHSRAFSGSSTLTC